MCDGACCGVCRRAAPPTAPAHRDSLPAMSPSRRGRPHRQIYKHACVHSLMTHSIYLSLYLSTGSSRPRPRGAGPPSLPPPEIALSLFLFSTLSVCPFFFLPSALFRSHRGLRGLEGEGRGGTGTGLCCRFGKVRGKTGRAEQKRGDAGGEGSLSRSRGWHVPT